MIDRKKVVKGLEEISDYFFSVYHHSKDREEINKAKDRCDAVEDALALLKEQEPMQVKMDMYGNAYCPWCSTDRTIEMGAQRLHLGTQFCPYCGQAVKWE